MAEASKPTPNQTSAGPTRLIRAVTMSCSIVMEAWKRGRAQLPESISTCVPSLVVPWRATELELPQGWEEAAVLKMAEKEFMS